MSQIAALNLPSELSAFIGRDRELAELTQTLVAGRLTTLTGVGGVGKTRLGLRLANEMAATFVAGVWLVELAGLSDPSLVPRSLATVLAVHEQPDRSMTDVLADVLRPRRLLVVLDNCEHLIEPCAGLVATLLRACPRLHVLATSREALGVPGEQVWPVPPLSLPDPSSGEASRQPEESEAVRLFVARCREALPGRAIALPDQALKPSRSERR